MGRWVAICLVLSMLGMLPPAGEVRAEATPTSAAGDFAGLVDIGGGRKMYLECRGSGGPTVILEAGFRTRADVWTDDLIQPDTPRTMAFAGIAEFTRVCLYDRPGTATVANDVLQPSRSDPVLMPRRASALVSDLHALLESAAIPGPYVLVGHSYGGLVMRLFASLYPDEVAGIVLVDAFAESLEDEMTPEQWAAYDSIFQPVPEALAGYPDLEFSELDASVDEVRDAVRSAPMQPMPMAVLSRGQAMAMPPDLPGGLSGAQLEGAWTASQAMLAALQPDARHIIAQESEHYIQLQQPDLVIEAVRAVVEAVREPDSWEQG